MSARLLSSTSLRRLRNKQVVLPEAQRANDIQDVERYNLWAVPCLPIDLPWVRDRSDLAPWRIAMRDDIRDNGLRVPLVVFGHSPKGKVNPNYYHESNRDRDESFYVMIGTNRYWCLKDLGWDVCPAIVSLNKGEHPPEEWGEHWQVSPSDFPKYAPDDSYRIWVREHAFGYKPLRMPADEFTP